MILRDPISNKAAAVAGESANSGAPGNGCGGACFGEQILCGLSFCTVFPVMQQSATLGESASPELLLYCACRLLLAQEWPDKGATGDCHLKISAHAGLRVRIPEWIVRMWAAGAKSTVPARA